MSNVPLYQPRFPLFFFTFLLHSGGIHQDAVRIRIVPYGFQIKAKGKHGDRERERESLGFLLDGPQSISKSLRWMTDPFRTHAPVS